MDRQRLCVHAGSGVRLGCCRRRPIMGDTPRRPEGNSNENAKSPLGPRVRKVEVQLSPTRIALRLLDVMPSHTDRPRVNCDHPRTRHVHGTRAAYVKDRCRCGACTAANSHAARAVYRAKAYGRWQPYVAGNEVREHVRNLLRVGLSYEAVASMAAVSRTTVRHLASASCEVNRVRTATATAVLAVLIPSNSDAYGVELELDPFSSTEGELDEVAIERAIAAEGVAFRQLTLREQIDAVDRLTKRGRSIQQIASTIGTSRRTVSRRRSLASP